jgi:hypothetical protein
VPADRYPDSSRPPGSAAALFDFLEDALHLFQLIPDLVDPESAGAVRPEVFAGRNMPGIAAQPGQYAG